MSASSTNGFRRFSRGNKCPVCGGCDGDVRGNGTRCFGYIKGGWIYCSREDHSSGCKFHPGSNAYAHRLRGPCDCGVEHNPSRRSNRIERVDRVYKYHDQTGQVVFEVVRLRSPKAFRQRRPAGNGKYEWNLNGVTPVLYHLPLILDRKQLDQPIYVVEGEKDVEALASAGRLATCNPGGAGKWRDSFSEALRARDVVILPDNDDAGREHAQKVAQSLHGKAASIKIVELPGLPEKGDVSDFLAAGGTVAQIDELARKASTWPPRGETNGTPVPPESLQAAPIVNRSGFWVSCLHNSKLWIEDPRREMSVRYDRFVRQILVDGEPLSDEIVIATTGRIEAETRSPWSQEHVRSAMIDIARRNAFSSQTEYLGGLEWDGVGRINRFFRDAYGCEESEYAIACARVLFISGAARAYEPGCQSDVMVVLIGDQGIGKSMGLSSLVPFPDWFTDDLPDLHDRKPAENLRGKWIVEFSEFSRINRATIQTVKSFISRRVDQYRPAYARLDGNFPRSCIFVGTTNDPHPLRDIENRRFMPIVCGRGDLDWIRGNRDQLWAEAVERYRTGEQWWVSDSALLAEARQYQEDARESDAWEDILEEKLRFRANITMQDAAEALGIRFEKLDRSTQTRIGTCLKKLGYVRSKPRRSETSEARVAVYNLGS